MRGKQADLILVKGQPLDDVALLVEPQNVTVVILGGAVAKDLEGRVKPAA